MNATWGLWVLILAVGLGVFALLLLILDQRVGCLNCGWRGWFPTTTTCPDCGKPWVHR